MARPSSFFMIAALGAALLIPASAGAKLPKTGTITPGKAVGKVRLGMKAATAVGKFGKGSNCDEVVGNVCNWEASGGAGISFEVRDEKVYSLSMSAGQRKNGTPVYSGAITKWKTSKGIHIGSDIADVQKAYKKATPSGSGVDLVQGKVRTVFESSGGRVAEIHILPVDG